MDWISVEDRLPVNDKECLCQQDFGDGDITYFVGHYEHGLYARWVENMECMTMERVKYWAPIYPP